MAHPGEDSRDQFDSSNLIVYLWKWRKPLIGITLLAGIVAAIFSGPFFIEPKYESTATVFPSTTNSLSKALLPQPFATANQDFLEFGEEEQAEQLLQMLNSDVIRRRIIDKYDLIKHYDIDTANPYAQTQLYETFDENISYDRTEFMSVEVSVLDVSPDTAAQIANDIIHLLDSVKNGIKRERALKGLSIIRNNYQELRREIKELNDSLTFLRGKGVHDYETQAAVLSEQLATAMIEKGVNSSVVDQIQRRLDTLGKYGSAYVGLRSRLSDAQDELSAIKVRYEQAQVDVNEIVPATFKINMAYPAEKKAYPIRWLIVVLSALGAFVATVIAILIIDTIRQSPVKEKG
jgi:uncharacterized protein involved in exopolysaccharide biosynthesis